MSRGHLEHLHMRDATFAYVSRAPFSRIEEYPGRSSFLRVGDRVYHTYSVYARGLETIGARITCSMRRRLGARRSGKSPRGAPRRRGARCPTAASRGALLRLPVPRRFARWA